MDEGRLLPKEVAMLTRGRIRVVKKTSTRPGWQFTLSESVRLQLVVIKCSGDISDLITLSLSGAHTVLAIVRELHGNSAKERAGQECIKELPRLSGDSSLERTLMKS
jgi:hypothetical protein